MTELLETPTVLAICLHCQKLRRPYHRGLCVACYRSEARNLYPTLLRRTAAEVPPEQLCKHCQIRVCWRARGLCGTCYELPELRHKYQTQRESVCILPTRPPQPTDAAPGSPAKVAVLEARYAAGEYLWHPLDAKGD